MAELIVEPEVIDLLFDLAESAIHDGLDGVEPRLPDVLPTDLRRRAGSFVTLHVGGELHGCIGSLAPEVIGLAVPRHAWAAAFRDPRFSRLRPTDLGQLDIEISVLSPPKPLDATSPDELIERIRPGVDGLNIEGGGQRAVFLPVVWHQLPEADEFVDRLYRKAGLTPRTWPSDMQVSVFSAVEFSRAATAVR